MRTFDDIIPPSKRKLPDTPPATVTALPPGTPRRRFPYTTLAVVLVVIASSLGALWFFSGAKIEIDPTTDPIVVNNGSFSASSNATSTLPFQLISTEKIATQSIASSGSETVSTSAQGPITIYNTQTTAQKLIATTRFESSNGLIFRIKSAVSVPGAKGTVPGQVTATVYADKPGDAYNIAAGSFTLPGFAGSAEFTKVYGKSTGPMSGGLVGTRPKTDPAAETAAQTALQAALKTDLESGLAAAVPDGFVLLPGASFTSFTPLPSQASQTTGSVDVREQGSAIGVVFPAPALASSVAAEVLGAAYHGEQVMLTHADTLKLASSGGAPSAGDTGFDFILSGNTTIVWSIDKAKIASAVAGKSRDSAQVVLSGFPEVRKALLILRPFWASSFPGDPASISVTVNPVQ